MTKVDYEFRKGIMFVRFLGTFINNNYKEIIDNVIYIIKRIGIKLVVFNLDNIKAIDAFCIDYLLKCNSIIEEEDGKMFICSNNSFKMKFLHRIPIIRNEIEAFNVI